jgi:antitoxin (DNA-binding transcriptional repressor) of toxin-antitoxin stability system
MKTLGIRELKTHLSRVLRDVAAGDVYLVTDRGRVVAELRSPGTNDYAASSPAQRALAGLAARGVLRMSERPAAQYHRSPLKSRGGLAKSLISADRGE